MLFKKESFLVYLFWSWCKIWMCPLCLLISFLCWRFHSKAVWCPCLFPFLHCVFIERFSGSVLFRYLFGHSISFWMFCGLLFLFFCFFILSFFPFALDFLLTFVDLFVFWSCCFLWDVLIFTCLCFYVHGGFFVDFCLSILFRLWCFLWDILLTRVFLFPFGRGVFFCGVFNWIFVCIYFHLVIGCFCGMFCGLWCVYIISVMLFPMGWTVYFL